MKKFYMVNNVKYAAKLVREITGILIEKGYIPIIYTDQNYSNSNTAYPNAGYENGCTLINFSVTKTGQH